MYIYNMEELQRSLSATNEAIESYLGGDENTDVWASIEHQRRLTDMYFRGRDDALRKYFMINKAKDIYNTEVEAPTTIWFITVNPSPQIELSKLITVMERWATNKLVEGIMYTFEQRGETMEELGKGKHIHMLIKCSERRGQLRQKLVQCFGGLVGNSLHIDVPPKPCSNKTLPAKIEYLLGIKEDAKMDKVKCDQEWRSQNNLEKIYSRGDTLLVSERPLTITDAKI